MSDDTRLWPIRRPFSALQKALAIAGSAFLYTALYGAALQSGSMIVLWIWLSLIFAGLGVVCYFIFAGKT